MSTVQGVMYKMDYPSLSNLSIPFQDKFVQFVFTMYLAIKRLRSKCYSAASWLCLHRQLLRRFQGSASIELHRIKGLTQKIQFLSGLKYNVCDNFVQQHFLIFQLFCYSKYGKDGQKDRQTDSFFGNIISYESNGDYRYDEFLQLLVNQFGKSYFFMLNCSFFYS